MIQKENLGFSRDNIISFVIHIALMGASYLVTQMDAIQQLMVSDLGMDTMWAGVVCYTITIALKKFIDRK